MQLPCCPGPDYTVAVASNQSGLARGLFDNDALQSMHDKLHGLVAAKGGHIDRIVVCPHGPDDDCDCRKPKPGLLLQLGAYYDVSLTGVPVVGDSLRDLEAAIAVGARPILVRSGNGRETEGALSGELASIESVSTTCGGGRGRGVDGCFARYDLFC